MSLRTSHRTGPNFVSSTSPPRAATPELGTDGAPLGRQSELCVHTSPSSVTIQSKSGTSHHDSNLLASPETDPHGSCSQLDPPILLSDLRSLQLLRNSNSKHRTGTSKELSRLWRQWSDFLQTSKGKTIKPEMLHTISNTFFFLRERRLSDLLGDIQAQKKSGIPYEGRTLRSLGFASVKAQSWDVLHWVLLQPRLSSDDYVVLVKAVCRKVAYTQSSEGLLTRADSILEVVKMTRLRMNNDVDLRVRAGLIIEYVSRTLLKMRCVDKVVPFVLQMLESHPATVDLLSQDFLYQVLNTCAAHQHLPDAHRLFAKIPLQLQTLDHFKACLTVWDRRTPRPLIRSACSIWHELLCHPYLQPDLTTHNLYLSLRCRLGHVVDVSKIVKRMERIGPTPDQRTYEILIHSVGQRKSTDSTWDIIQQLSPSKYVPTARTANILLCSKARQGRSSRRPQDQAEQVIADETSFVRTMDRLKTAKIECDQITRNLVVRRFLSRSHSHSDQQIWALKEMALPPNLTSNSMPTSLTRSEFRRYQRPLYSMLWSAFTRVGYMDDAAKLADEWEQERRRARSSKDVKTKREAD